MTSSFIEDIMDDALEDATSVTSAQLEEERLEEERKSRRLILPDNISLSNLPPLPPPHVSKRRQRNGGITVVLISIFCFVGTTHGLALEVFDGFEYHSTRWWVFFILIYSQAGLAILGLFAMLIANPGVVERSKKTCFPVPQQMAPSLNDYFEQRGRGGKQFFPPSQHYLPAEDGSGDTYCVRCLLWRRSKDGPHYHCNTCQRCVKHYDHHCGVFGRCIAGKLFSVNGNYKYFVILCSLFVTAFWTSFAAIVWSLSNVYGPAWVVPISLAVVLYLVITTRVLILGPQALCRACRQRA
mmetsp:Transcript_26584/g.64821  ORF Transcript_26584/g.64821 Transcript_26584/m.64821 type:complete len:297 (-) Transcript_26584:78-968(-)